MLIIDHSPAKSYRFRKDQRLLVKADYDFVFKSAKRLSTRWFLLLYRPRPTTTSATNARLGLIIAKKSAKLAVHRNRIKRQIRESFRLQQYQLPNVDVIILAKKSISTIDNTSLNKELRYLWQKLAQQH